jgi:hypothetical protein
MDEVHYGRLRLVNEKLEDILMSDPKTINPVRDEAAMKTIKNINKHVTMDLRSKSGK